MTENLLKKTFWSLTSVVIMDLYFQPRCPAFDKQKLKGKYLVGCTLNVSCLFTGILTKKIGFNMVFPPTLHALLRKEIHICANTQPLCEVALEYLVSWPHLGLSFPSISMPWTAVVKKLRHCSWYQILLVAVRCFLLLLLTLEDKEFIYISFQSTCKTPCTEHCSKKRHRAVIQI